MTKLIDVSAFAREEDENINRYVSQDLTKLSRVQVCYMLFLWLFFVFTRDFY